HREITLASCAVFAPVVADFNGDGINDIGVSESAECQPFFTTNTLNILLGKPDGTYQPEQVVYTSDDHFLETLAPLRSNTDQKPDILVQTLSQGRTVEDQLLFTNTTSPFATPKCAPPIGAVGFNLCSPTKTVYSANPIHFNIGAANQTPGRKIEV